MKRRFSILLTAISICVLNAAIIVAMQGTAQINGTVKDQTGAVLPGVSVKATHTDTGIVRETFTDETGSYILPNLVTGPYRLEAILPGFRTFVQTGIVLNLNANPTINAVMEVGQVTEVVEVQGNATMVETASLSVRQVIETQQILELPLNGRNATELIILAGGAVAFGGTSSTRAIGGGVGISVAGLHATASTYTLDGANHNNVFDNLNLPIPFPDALQEFSVQTGAQNAQSGFFSGAQVGAVTKSGTNQFHGDVFDFVRNDRFKASEYFATQKGKQRRHQIGGTLGGPIVQNKLFFFGGYQGTFNREDDIQVETFIPTARMLAGDFTEIVKVYTDPAGQTGGCRTTPVNNTGTGATPGQLRAGFVDNRIDPSLFNRVSLGLVARFPKPIDECGRLRYGRIASLDEGQYVGKIDYQMSDNHSIFGRAMLFTVLDRIPFEKTPDNILNTLLGGKDHLGQFYTIGSNYLINATTVNSARLAVNRTAVHRLGPDYFAPADLGIKAFSYLPKTFVMTVADAFALGGTSEVEGVHRSTNYQLSNDLTMVRGAHQAAFGATLMHWRINTRGNSRSMGIFTFTSDSTGLGMADFLLGRLNNLRQGGQSKSELSQWFIGLHASDTWKVSPRFTLNAGIRWEPYFPQNQRDRHIHNFSLERFQAGVKTAQYNNAPAGFYYPGDPEYPGNAGHRGSWLVFAPRVGLGFDPIGDGKMSIRASYGLSYDFVDGQYHIGTKLGPPFANEVTVSTGTFDDPWANYPGGNPFPYVLDKNVQYPQYGVFLSLPYDIKKTYVQTWSLSVERELPSSLFLRVSYQGNGTRHLWWTRPLNPAVYYPGSNCTLPNGRFISGTCSTTGASNVNERRVLSLANYANGQYIGALDAYDDSGTQSYNGMIVTLDRRAGRNLTLSGNYTWSHCIGNDSNLGGTINVNTGSLDGDRKADRGNCGSDRRHVFNSSVVAEIPQFADRTLRYIASGWRISNIYRQSTGSYFTVTPGTDVARIGGNLSQQRVVQLKEEVFAPGRPTGPRAVYLDQTAFAQPATGTLAPNKGLRNVVGPGTWQWDASVSRIFRIGETKRIEARVEAYNVTNSFRPGNLGNTFSSLNSATFGQINASLEPRDMQFALKYIF